MMAGVMMAIRIFSHYKGTAGPYIITVAIEPCPSSYHRHREDEDEPCTIYGERQEHLGS